MITETQDLRDRIREWIKQRVDESGAVVLPDLAKEAATKFAPKLKKDGLDKVLPELLYPFAYGIGADLLYGTRKDIEGLTALAFGLDNGNSPMWMEHANGRHLPVAEMRYKDLVSAADAREKRARTELRIASTFRNWATNISHDQKVGGYLSKTATRRPVVYMAGKVGGSSDWRCQILRQYEPRGGTVVGGKTEDLLRAPDNYWYEHYKNYSLPVLHSDVYDTHLHPHVGPGTWPKIGFVEGFDYVGPYYRDVWGGHGVSGSSNDGDGWGVEHAGTLDLFGDGSRYHQYVNDIRPAIHKACLSAIREATHVFLWLDDVYAYGTLVEIGYARALGKPIYAAVSEFLQEKKANPYAERTITDDMWFALEGVERLDEVGGEPFEAFDNFLLWAGVPMLAK